MRKNLFFVATAALVLASCNNDVKLDENTAPVGSNVQKEIALTPYAQKAKHSPSATTNGAIEGATYPDQLTMQVAAYAMPNSSTWAAAGYFDKTPFDGNNASNWTGTPARYWPLSDAYVTFLAVAGVADTKVTKMYADAEGTTAYASGATVTYDADCFTAQTDLMYSGKQAEVEKTGNTLVFPTDVDMTFKHALSLLKFRVRAASGDYDDKFAITKIEIVGANKTGTFTITNANYDSPATDPTTTGEWGSFSAAADYDVPSSDIDEGNLTTEYQSCGQALLVPKPAEAAFTKFVIYYTLDGKAFTFDYTPESTILAQATKYVYNITFTLHEIIIDPVIENWADGGTEYVEIPANPMAYGTNYSVVATADAQKLKFKINGLAGDKYIKVTKGVAAGDAQITATSPALTEVTAETATSETITVTLSANETSDKEMTVTIQEYNDAEGSVVSGTATVITITQAH